VGAHDRGGIGRAAAVGGWAMQNLHERLLQQVLRRIGHLVDSFGALRAPLRMAGHMTNVTAISPKIAKSASTTSSNTPRREEGRGRGARGKVKGERGEGRGTWRFGSCILDSVWMS